MEKLLVFVAFLIYVIVVRAQAPRLRGRGASMTRPLRPARRSNGVSGECRSLRTRSITGRCTSVSDPILGEARRPQFSYLDVDTAEFNDMGLPSPRFISNTVSEQEGRTINAQGLNDMFTFMGQFIDHDFALSPFSDPREQQNIEVPENDPELDVDELEFVRSQRATLTSSSNLRPITVLTSALDLSNVYGSDEERNIGLRVPDSCRLKTSPGNLLPLNEENFINSPSTSNEFFFAGDTRSNETPMLTAMHTIWVREHNRICEEVEQLFSNRSPRNQYEIARAITIAEYQKVIYEEWLPAILGSRRLSNYNGHDRNVDPTISLEFTTAGFRLGHTMVGTDVARVDNNGNSLPSRPSEDQFFVRASEITNDEIENFLRGASKNVAEEFDERAVDVLRNFLFENVEEEEGFDLIALNLQRSRDHNVPKFNELREFFLGSRVSSFDEISSNPTTSANLEVAYGDVDNVEAWIGLMAEDKNNGIGVGRTLEALLVTEFERLRDGDQFFYKERNQIPRRALNRIDGIENEIFSDDPLFNRILLRNTDINPELLDVDSNAFII
ncbi:Eosinophil peroxidase [Gracilariopsis chorda]|uniref:Eosinophil peroxidase n=1 Tax=Gracilariopsis chorda TaxID=448386 RepID=A0A2V3IN81_9FLOR|nr:Eosinophil peroxidase [Gracilariopsis chorda]|eukprot:PXF43541.1 Eosinophil peroxidase [Gracilariopsis chorda]